MPDRLTVAAPASSANLGPGFDCLAVALELRNDVVLTARDDDRLVVTIEGEGAGEASTGPDNLFLRAFERGRRRSGRPRRSHAEHGARSRAGWGRAPPTIAAGLTAGAAWSGADGLDLLAMATELEGHPDNVAAALNGGLTLAWQGDGRPAGGRLRAAAGRVRRRDRGSAARDGRRAGRPAGAGAARGRGAHGGAGRAAGGGAGGGRPRPDRRGARRPPARALPGGAGAAAGRRPRGDGERRRRARGHALRGRAERARVVPRGRGGGRRRTGWPASGAARRRCWPPPSCGVIVS